MPGGWLECSGGGGEREGTQGGWGQITTGLAGAVRTLASTPNDMGRHGDILNRGDPRSDLSGCRGIVNRGETSEEAGALRQGVGDGGQGTVLAVEEERSGQILDIP